MRLFLILSLLLIFNIINAQEITGSAKDETGTAISGATVSLVRSKDSSVVKLAITNTDGSFQFSGMKDGNYKLLFSHVGFKKTFTPEFNYNGASTIAPQLKPARVAANLTNVTVTAAKPLVELRADKTILNVEGTINAIGSNALELLRKSPGVLMDKDDNISLAAKNGVQVYIDNRQTALSGQELANYLKTLQSAQIEAIELITNPSAKYDAAGNAGIINIRLVKNKALGTNGTLNAGWNMGKTAKYNGGFSLNHRNKSMNIFVNYNYTYNTNEQNLKVYRTVLDSIFDQAGTVNETRKTHNFKTGVDFFIGKKNTIGVMVNGIIATPVTKSNSRTVISNNNQVVSKILAAQNENRMERRNSNLNLNYNYVDPKGKTFSINADYGQYKLENDQYQPNTYFDAAGQVKTGEFIYHIISPAEINIKSVKADYEQNFLKGKVGFGGKVADIKTDNDFRRYNVLGPTEDLDKERSNHFIYKENINAGYVNYNRAFKKWMFQVGVRVENTVSEGNSTGLKFNGTTYVATNTGFKRGYTDFFPSASLTINKNPKSPWSISFSRRIDRPAYQDLNPFEFKLDEYTFMKGNINLRPQYTNSFGISHTTKTRMMMSLNYSHVKDMFTQMFDTTEKSKAFMTKRNLAEQDIINLTVSYPFQYKSYSLFANVTTNYSSYRADFGTGRKVDLEALGFNLFVQNSLKFKKTWTAELNGFYNAPTIYQGGFKGKAMYNVDAGISKQVMKGKATVKASFTDVFRTMRFRATSDFAGQVVRFNYRQESQQLKLAFSYRFGSNTVKAARQRTGGAEDELKRVQQSGGLMGN